MIFRTTEKLIVFSNTDIQNEEQLDDYILKTKPIKDGYIFSGYIIDLESPTKSYSILWFNSHFSKQLENDNTDQLSNPLKKSLQNLICTSIISKYIFSEIINNKVNKRW